MPSAGQAFDLSYTVVNTGGAGTPSSESEWDDYFYLSRDKFLDVRADRYLGYVRHTGGLDAGGSYEWRE